MKHYIAIDLGATSGRVILASLGENKLEMETVHRFPTPLININGKYCWNIYSIYDDIVKGLSEIGKRGLEIESIGVDTWGVDFVCVAADGTLAGLPRSYRDPYTEGIPEEFFEKMPRRELYNRTGIQIMNINSVFQLYAQKKEGSSALENAESILFMPDAISYLLTGEKVCEYTILSTSALMDPHSKKIDPEILKVCSLDAGLFPRIVFPGEKVGTLNNTLAASTGLGKIPVIAVAGHDTGSAVAAVPAVKEGFVYLSSGTWSLMGIETREPVINDRMFDLNFTNEGGVAGTTRLLKNITGMWLLEQCLLKWKEHGRSYTYAQLVQMAQELPPSSGVIDPDDGSFASPTDMPAAICAYCAANGMEAPADDAHMVRLIYDSLAAKYAQVFRSLQEISPVKLEVLHIIGGGSQNRFLNQLTADRCGVSVVAGPAEGTALGNVMVQAGIHRNHLPQLIHTETFNPKKYE